MVRYTRVPIKEEPTCPPPPVKPSASQTKSSKNKSSKKKYLTFCVDTKTQNTISSQTPSKSTWLRRLGVRTIGKITRHKKRQQKDSGLDLQKFLAKSCELHWPGYQYMEPGTKIEKRLKRGEPGINGPDRIAKQHNTDYSSAKNLQDQ